MEMVNVKNGNILAQMFEMCFPKFNSKYISLSWASSGNALNKVAWAEISWDGKIVGRKLHCIIYPNVTSNGY